MERKEVDELIGTIVHTLEKEADHASIKDRPFGEGLRIGYSNSSKIVEELYNNFTSDSEKIN